MVWNPIDIADQARESESSESEGGQGELEYVAERAFEAGVNARSKLRLIEYLQRPVNGELSPNSCLRRIQHMFTLFSNITPGMSQRQSNQHSRARLITLLELVGMHDAVSDLPNEPEGKIVCDGCNVELPWGYESWKCIACPMFTDFCAECRSSKNITRENCRCEFHQKTDWFATFEAYEEYTHMWECVAIVERFFRGDEEDVEVGVEIRASDSS